MGSSYNNFLANIEVDEKQIKRDMAKRELAKQKQKQYNDQNKVKPKARVSAQNSALDDRGSRNSSVSKRKNEEIQPNRDRVKQTETSQNRNYKGERENRRPDAKRSESTKHATVNREQGARIRKEQRNSFNNTQSVPLRISQKEKAPLRLEDKTARSNAKSVNNPSQISGRSSRANETRKNALTRERLQKENIHLRQKKIRNSKSDKTKESDQIHLTMSKTEYNQKVLGTIRENSTKFILFKDSTKLAKVPKGVAFLGVYAFILSAIMLYYFSQVAVVKMELSKVNEEYFKLNEVNAQLNIKLATAYNIDNIRQRAENELYMSKPEPHQIMYISVVPENFVEYEIDTEESKKDE